MNNPTEGARYIPAITNDERKQWIQQNASLYSWFRSTGHTIERFIELWHDHIDYYIKNDLIANGVELMMPDDATFNALKHFCQQWANSPFIDSRHDDISTHDGRLMWQNIVMIRVNRHDATFRVESRNFGTDAHEVVSAGIDALMEHGYTYRGPFWTNADK